MSLRTYSLIVHPAYLRFVEERLGRPTLFAELAPVEVPAHRPGLSSIYDIADYVGVSSDLIRYILRNKSKHYRTFEFRKKSGGTRRIDAPRTLIKVVQWWILDSILANTYLPEYVFGFARGRSFIQNAQQHIGARHILNVDVRDFFPSVSRTRVQSIFEALGYDKNVAYQLSDITTLEERLPQGAPTSPGLANLAFAEADSRLQQLAEGKGLKYTRYADDLTFSSIGRIDKGLPELIEEVISDYGFSLNRSKTRFMGINNRLEVTGLIVGEEEVSLSREYLNSARGWFHSMSRQDTYSHESEQKLRGTIQLIAQVGGRGAATLVEQGALALQNLTLLKAKSAVEVRDNAPLF